MTDTTTTPAQASGTFAIGGDLEVNRLGYGTMQLTGPGVWGDPKDPDEAVRVLRTGRDGDVAYLVNNESGAAVSTRATLPTDGVPELWENFEALAESQG